MKVLYCIFLLSLCGLATAAPSLAVINSCLRIESKGGVKYTDIAPHTFNEEYDEALKMTSTTFKHRQSKVGMWEIADNNAFGLIYRGKNVATSEVVALSDKLPSIFNPYTAQWGEAHEGRHSFVCITFNFEGLGESGSYQNIRALYLIDIIRKPARYYYIVGDVRHLRE
jgi:hypothetical protein